MESAVLYVTSLFCTALIHPMHDIGSPLATILHQHYQCDTHDLQVLKLVTHYCLLLHYYQLITNILGGTAGSYTIAPSF